MHFCNAFDQHNNPCLNETENDVCEMHEFYYEKWLQRFVIADNSGKHFFFTSSRKLKAVYVKAIVESRVKITQQHFKDLERKGRALYTLVDYYLLCCCQPGVDPLWSTKLFTESIRMILNCHRSCYFYALQTNKDILTQFLDPIFNSTLRSFGYMLCHTLYTCVSLESILAHGKHTSAAHIDDPSGSLIQYLIDHPKFKSEFLWQHIDAEQKLLGILSSSVPSKGSLHEKIKTFVESFPSRRLDARQKKKISFQDQKEEIVQIGWHPSRLLKWCLSTDDLQDLKSRWNCLDSSEKLNANV